MTRNTEYHFRDGFCVAVRDRRTGDFRQSHLALRRRIQGGIKFYMNGGIQPNLGEPKTGEALYFESGGHDLVTSPLIAVERPSKSSRQAYTVPVKVRRVRRHGTRRRGRADPRSCAEPSNARRSDPRRGASSSSARRRAPPDPHADRYGR